MQFSYDQGTYIEGGKHLTGTIILSEHKLFLKDDSGDLAATFIPLEKIERIKLSLSGLRVYVHPSLTMHYIATFKGKRERIRELAKDIAAHRGLKKKFLMSEWVDLTFFDS